MRILHTKLTGPSPKESKYYACGQRAEGAHYWTGGDIEEWLELYNRDQEYEPCKACLSHPMYPLFLLSLSEV